MQPRQKVNRRFAQTGACCRDVWPGDGTTGYGCVSMTVVAALCAAVHARNAMNMEQQRSVFISWCLGVLGLLILLLPPAYADDGPWVRPGDLDLARFLPDPPAAGAAAAIADLAAVHAAQAGRTPALVAAVKADQEVSMFRFADVLGPRFNAEALPRTTALGRAACRDVALVVAASKRHWQRPRPFVADPDIVPVATIHASGSYPSGHAACGYLWGILLADMVPEQRAALFTRGIVFGDNRIAGGVHYPSDVEAGRMAAVAVAALLYRDAAFLATLEAARSELRSVLLPVPTVPR